MVDALGNPLRVLITPGQAHEGKNALSLLDQVQECDYVLADRAYDSEANLQRIRELGAEPVIPAGSGRIRERKIDWHLYKERHLVEVFFAHLKHFRRIATRYEKTQRHFQSFVLLACARRWLI